ncbi:MAG: hypothetical protein KGH67_01840 [Candidatus Micrarchaeota archaeon]|nr:hypothetical protein [Candidatus Micrarchaeota archaeon]MDE1859247.1 hypothetical protein [Candidatus Micrarchaeota archaeon]
MPIHELLECDVCHHETPVNYKQGLTIARYGVKAVVAIEGPEVVCRSCAYDVICGGVEVQA